MYNDYLKQIQKISDISNTISLLHWDMQTHMPKGGAKFRGQQISTLTSLVHDYFTGDEFGKVLENLKNDNSLDEHQSANIRETLKSYERSNKLNADFVARMSKASSEGFNAWQKAHHAGDFSLFQNELEKIIELKKEEADLVGYDESAYDALLDEYEPGMKASEVDHLFDDMKQKLTPLMQQIRDTQKEDRDFLFKNYDGNKQWDFGLKLLEKMGYDFEHGRQDKSTHPFTINMSPEDVRVTTRVNENDLMEMIGSTVHEGGHALYEQGLPSEYYGTPCSQYISLGIHESMSRFWENNIGLSREYWSHFYPELQSTFRENLGDVDLNRFLNAINLVVPSFIRTSADEVTYHFHVLIRYEIEKDLLSGKLKVADLPECWNQKYSDYLGVKVEDNKKGCLQDVHWSQGAFGYFPTYSIGSFYAAQWHHQIQSEFADFGERVAKGELLFIRDWLKEKIYRHGRFYSARELCKNITGEELNIQYFVDYITKKHM
jgi:carboxypeptidase Taq